jgi:hypothetical protein
VGGGSGLNLGKDRVKKMVEAFGGKVTSSVSGRTHILVVGKEPGLGKVSQAEGQPGCQLMVRFARVYLSLCELDKFVHSILKTSEMLYKMGGMFLPLERGPS